MSPELLTLAEVEARVARIRDIKDDNEVAHGEEDDLHFDVLRAIAEGHPDPVALARAALETSKIEFVRWFA